MIKDFFNTFHLSWNSFIHYLPALIGGILCFVLTFFVASSISKIASRSVAKKTKDSLIGNFIGKIIWAVIFILGTVLALGILGLGSISNKILAGAGITTFVIGFALKDIGENFLAGILLAFSRPYHVGNYIECGSAKGIVKDMTLRQTTVEADNGKIILIPNSMIVTNPLVKYLNNDNNMRQEIYLNIETTRVKEAIVIIDKTLREQSSVSSENTKKPKIIIDSLVGDKAKVLVIFWYETNTFSGSRSGSRSAILLSVMEHLNAATIKFTG